MNEKELKAKKYSKTNRIISVIETLIFYSVLLILLFTGLSKEIESVAYSYSENPYFAILIFFGIIGIAEMIITFPLSFYSGYILEHKYELSNQTTGKYFFEKLKGTAVGLIIGVPLLLIFFFILRNYGDIWWLVLGIFLFLFSIVMGRIAPVLIMPLFYKFKPLENDEIKNRITEMTGKAGVKIEGIYSFDMSKNTKKANAAFTGMGKSKRIIIGDTLLDNFNEDEIEMVFAHEMGHYTKKHIWKLVLFSTVITFAGLYLTSELYNASLGFFNFTSIDQIAAIPLLFLYLSLYGLITTPLSNILSRKFEWEADTYALKMTKNKEAFISTMEKLADQNLSDKNPNKIIEFLFHSHPSIEKRIEFAKEFTLT
jgi:STE24 endopeptidase